MNKSKVLIYLILEKAIQYNAHPRSKSKEFLSNKSRHSFSRIEKHL